MGARDDDKREEAAGELGRFLVAGRRFPDIPTELAAAVVAHRLDLARA